MDDRYTAIILRISVSDTVVSSKPGVSTRVTSFPNISNVFAVSTLEVHDLKPWPTDSFEPLMRLMNCSDVSSNYHTPKPQLH